MPRGARLTARQKAQQAVEKQEAKVAKLHERGKRLSAELHRVEADWRAESETLEYLRSHPALQGAVYDKGGVGAPEPIVRTGQIDEFIHTGPTTIGEEVQKELDAIPKSMSAPFKVDVGDEEPKLTPNQIDPRDEPGEQIPPIKYDPPPKHEEDRERFVQADPFA